MRLLHQAPTSLRPAPPSGHQPNHLPSTLVVKISTCRRSTPIVKMMMIPTPKCSLFPSGHRRRSWRVFSGSRMGWKLTRSSGQLHRSLLRILSRRIRKSRNTVTAPAARTGPDPMALLKRRFGRMLPNDSGCGSMAVGASTASDQHDSVKFSFLNCKSVCTLNSGGLLLGSMDLGGGHGYVGVTGVSCT